MTSRRSPRLVFTLLRAERSVRRWIDARAVDTAVGAAGAGVLFHLEQRAPSSIGDISRALDASPAATTALLNRLAAANVITKSPDPADARSTRIALTDHGPSLLPGAKQIPVELNVHLADGFTPAELEIVDRWLAHTATLPTAAPRKRR